MEHNKTHPKDRDLPGFTHDSAGRPKSGDHHPGETSGMDVAVSIADVLGVAMYGEEGWKTKQRATKRRRRTKAVIATVVTVMLLSVSVLVMIAVMLGLIVVINWLVESL